MIFTVSQLFSERFKVNVSLVNWYCVHYGLFNYLNIFYNEHLRWKSQLDND